MRYPNFSFFSTALAFACLCFTGLTRAVDTAIDYGVSLFDRALGFIASAFKAEPLNLNLSPAMALDGPAMISDAPPAHELRHEAGTARMSAARNN